jgi:hypothetical protein
METMKNPISIVDAVPIAVYTGDQNGAAIDMHQGGDYEAALFLLGVGNFTGTPTTVTVAIYESDDAAFGTSSVAAGGAAQTVVADTAYRFQVKRTKRYLRPVVDFTGGTTPTAELHMSAILNNWAVPMNIR